MRATQAVNGARRWSLSAVVGATGIVYGDIGTSPLYAMEESLNAAGAFNTEAVLGVLSLIFWSLAISVTLKYVSVIMRADNDGEGGILALFALAKRGLIAGSAWSRVVIVLALAGTAFFFCDALITPAISVLGAVEGLELLDPGFERAVIPVTLGVLTGLFAYQRRGTARVASLFGPVMVVWFVALAATGTIAIGRNPHVLVAVDPLYGIALLSHRPDVALAIIGAVFLAVTGGEALYADMGHFGKEPVRIAWFALVWPALIINYYGQGALLLEAAVAPCLEHHEQQGAERQRDPPARGDLGEIAGDEHRVHQEHQAKQARDRALHPVPLGSGHERPENRGHEHRTDNGRTVSTRQSAR